MRAFVFTDKSLARHAGRFVWLAMDAEQAKNAPYRKQLPVQALPTFFIVDPADERVAIRWVGGMTVAQLDQLLQDPLAAKRTGKGLDRMLARADSLYGVGDNAEAAKAYSAALAQAPSGWPGYSRSVEALLYALSGTEDHRTSVAVAHDALPVLRHTPSVANVVTYGLDGALGLPADDPERPARVREFETAARAALADTTLRLPGDDRSGIYGSLLDARQDAKDDAGYRATAREWSQMLDGEAARAKTKEQRVTYDPHRLSAYIEVGTPEKAVPMLEQSEREFPDDYNPPARLAIAYRAMKRWDLALAASDRAMSRAYGPRKLQLYQTRADIYAGSSDSTTAKRTLEEAVRYAEALPPGQRSDRTIESLKKKLAVYR